MEKCFTTEQIKDIIKENEGKYRFGDKPVDTDTQKTGYIKMIDDEGEVQEVKVESEKYVDMEMWGIDINVGEGSEAVTSLERISAHFCNKQKLEKVLTSLNI